MKLFIYEGISKKRNPKFETQKRIFYCEKLTKSEHKHHNKPIEQVINHPIESASESRGPKCARIKTPMKCRRMRNNVMKRNKAIGKSRNAGLNCRLTLICATCQSSANIPCMPPVLTNFGNREHVKLRNRRNRLCGISPVLKGRHRISRRRR